MNDEGCAFCGEDGESVVAGDDGEWFCSTRCADAHDEFGCPLELSDSARDTMVNYALSGATDGMPRTYLRACENREWERAAWIETQSAERWISRLAKQHSNSERENR